MGNLLYQGFRRQSAGICWFVFFFLQSSGLFRWRIACAVGFRAAAPDEIKMSVLPKEFESLLNSSGQERVQFDRGLSKALGG